MSRIVPTSWRVLVKIFVRFGCEYKRKEGSHHVLSYPGAKRVVVIPEYDEVDVEIIKNNMRTVNMSREEYFALLTKVCPENQPSACNVEAGWGRPKSFLPFVRGG
jgi:predicted RNA binding protein YcfA (HicA-like mRNA interferase family)